MGSARLQSSATSLPEPRLDNLPLELTSFVGRDREVAEIKRLLAERRLLTLCGPGGAGKTRLALAVTQDLVEEFEGGVWWVDLAPLSDPELVARTVASAVGVAEAPDLSPFEALIEHLKSRKTLLILDNCEHLVEECAELADTLLRTCPELEILATSREPLRVAGESSWQVPSLSLPDAGRSTPVSELAGYEAVHLFVERAQAVEAGFTLTEDNAPAVARLCQKLDGIPLAIELAAARSRVLSVEQISERLEDPLGLLTTGDRSSAPRQRTLRATLEWSYGLLSEAERVLFRRLSVFVGGWDLDAAEAVWGGQPAQAGLVLDLLSALVDKSLVVAEAEAGGPLRYGMLEPVRHFGCEKLHESEEEPEVRRRHAEHYLALAETAGSELLGPDQGLWLQRIRTEFANLREAHSWSLEPGEEEERAGLRLRLPAALWRFWLGRRFEDGKAWLQTALESDPGGFPAVRARALDGLGYILLFQQDYERAIAALEEAVALDKELGDRSGTAFALGNLGYAMLHGGYMERVPAFVREAEALMAGDLDGHARAYLRQILGTAAILEGDLDSAVAQFEEGLAMTRGLGDLRNTSMALFNLGMVALVHGELDRGATLHEEGTRISRELGDRVGGLYYVWGFGKLSALRKNPVRAAKLWGAAEALRERMGMSLSYLDLNASGYEQDLAAVRSELDEASFDAAWAEGRAMSPDEATEYALEVPPTPYEEAPADAPSPAHPPVERPGEDDGGLRNNLPVAQSGFVGREREMAEVMRALSMTRLLTLTGAGGCGKTRLAVEVARDLVDASPRAYPDGVWLVELASLSEGELVPGAVAAALGLREQADVPFNDALVDFLRSRRMLLILDNCEHLIEDCARLVDTLLGACENLRVLATSREALGVAGEVNWTVPSLTLPEAGARFDPENLTCYEAIELFVQRARSRLPAFELTRENATAVADVCRRLDGMPLAIELATARIGALSVEQISERLGDSLEFLKTAERTVAPRQRTLKATLAWSYELLSQEERELFGRLAVFAGGWTLEAAEAMGIGERVEAERVLDLLSGLVDKSLVVAEPGGERGPRYRMLEPVRQYALELLEEDGEAGQTRGRHAAFFVALAEEAYPKLRAAPQVEWLQRLETENGNLRGALSWALSAGEIPTAARLGYALWPFWWIRNRQIEGRRWTEQVLLERDELPPPLRIRATIATASMAYGQGDADALPRFTAELLELSRAEGGDALAEAYAHAGLGLLATALGDFEVATPNLEEALPLFREAGEYGMAAQTPTWLGTILLLQGDHEGARRRFEEGLALARSLGERVSTHNALFNLAQLALAEGDYESAFLRFAEAIALSEELGDRGSIAWILEGLGVVAGARGDALRAARLLGASQALISAIGLRGHPEYHLDRDLYELVRAEVTARLGEAAFEAAMQEGRAMTPEQATEFALEGPASSEEVVREDVVAPGHPPGELPKDDTDRRRRHNLPAARSTLVGREREIDEVMRALSATRLLTITGAGGCGKTRLALEVARNLAGAHTNDYPDGVWLVELASLGDGALVPAAVAAALGLREHFDVTFTDTIADSLQSRRMLLVLDNCEHLIEACADLVDELLGACGHLRILATSREALGVTGETNFIAPSLTVPEAGQPLDPEDLGRYESVRLFVERARSRSPGFALDAENAAVVADICRKLDGIPLAIELATARMGALTVEQISERLGDSLSFLTTGDRTRAPRQRTLRAALAWGYDLLSAPEQLLFGRLSVFEGGWTLQAAKRVGAAGDIGAEDVLDLLSRLVQQSLVLAEAETGEGASRYRMLEPVRQYALERLERGGEAQDVRDRHAALFTSMAEQAHTELRGQGQVGWMRRLVQENDNLRAAMAWALSSGDYETAALLGWALWPFWFYRGNHREGRHLLERVLQSELELPTELRIKATVAAAVMAYGQGDNEWVVEYMTDLLELSRQVGGDAYAEGYAKAGLGLVAMNRGDLVTAAARLEEALPLFLECGELWTASQTHTWIGTVLLLQGDQERAVARFEEGLALARWIEDRASTYNALYALAQVALIRGEYELATSSFREGMGLSEEMGDLANVAYCLEGLATVAGARDEAERSARLFGVAHGLHETIGAPVWTYYNADRSLYERTMADLREALGEAAFEMAFSEGRAMSPERAIEYALDAAVPEPPTAELARISAAKPAPAREEVHQERLRVLAFGAARVEKEGLPLESPDWIQKSRELLYYLLSHPEGRTKEQIGLALWPEASTAQLRSSFHDTVFRLRRALGGKEWVVFEKRRYAFGRTLDYSYDVAAFEENISEASRLQDEAPEQAIQHLQAAASLYQGDFLEDFAAGEWAFERQDNLRRANGEALLHLAELLSARGRHAEAADAYRKAIAHDRFVEEAHRGLMRSHSALGEPGRALRHFEELAKMLENQLGSSPAPETVALYERLREGRAAE
jgi:non-specific serine/threonine protein kinase